MVVLDWTRIWSSVAMIEYAICFVIFLFLGFEFLKNNRREAKAVGVVFLGGGIKSLINLVYHIFYNGKPAPTWFFAFNHIFVLVTLLYLIYILVGEKKTRKENGNNGR